MQENQKSHLKLKEIDRLMILTRDRRFGYKSSLLRQSFPCGWVQNKFQILIGKAI